MIEPAEKNSEPKRRRRDKWLTRCAIVWIIVGLVILATYVFQVAGMISDALATIALSAFIVFILHGLVNFFERKGMSRGVGSLLALLIFLVILAALVFAFVPAIVEQLTALIRTLPTYITQVQNFLEDLLVQSSGSDPNGVLATALNSAAAWLSSNSGSLVSQIATGAMQGVADVVNAVIVFITSLIVSFWVLADLPTICREFRTLFSDEHQKDLDVISTAIGNAFYGWLRTTLICALINGILCGIVFAIMGMPYSVLLGLICGLLYFIPYIGPAVACIVCAIVALFVSPLVFILTIVLTIVIHNVVASGISPALMKDSVNVHPAIILVVLLAGGALGGIVGMFLAIPLAAAVQGIFTAYFEARTGKTLATEDGALFQAKAEHDRKRYRRRRERFGRNSKRRAKDDEEPKDGSDTPSEAEADAKAPAEASQKSDETPAEDGQTAADESDDEAR